MSKIDDGGAAFPIEADYIRGDYRDGEEYKFKVEHQPGMTLRTWLAAHAGADDVSRHIRFGGGGKYRTVEQAKFVYADAMIAAGKAGNDE